MKYFRYIIILWFLGGFLSGCRAKLDTSSQYSYRHADEIGVVLQRLESLSSTIAERQDFKIEFYPPSEYCVGSLGSPGIGTSVPTDPTATSLGNASQTGSVGGGIGAVKSIEIDTERDVTTTATSAVDSTAVFKTEQEATLQKQKASETRQDNGTIAIVSVVAAVVVILALLIIIKKFFHK